MPEIKFTISDSDLQRVVTAYTHRYLWEGDVSAQAVKEKIINDIKRVVQEYETSTDIEQSREDIINNFSNISIT